MTAPTRPLGPTAALAMRRAGLAAGVLSASLVAHIVATDRPDLTPVAPVVWVGLIAAGALLGPRHHWRCHGTGGLLAILGLWQIIAHLTMIRAPWLFGLEPHHHPGLELDPTALAIHAAAAIGLALTLTRLERALERAMATVARALGALTRPPSARRRPTTLVPAVLWRLPRTWRPARPPCRGPPRLVGLRAGPSPGE